MLLKSAGPSKHGRLDKKKQQQRSSNISWLSRSGLIAGLGCLGGLPPSWAWSSQIVQAEPPGDHHDFFCGISLGEFLEWENTIRINKKSKLIQIWNMKSYDICNIHICKHRIGIFCFQLWERFFSLNGFFPLVFFEALEIHGCQAPGGCSADRSRLVVQLASMIFCLSCNGGSIILLCYPLGLYLEIRKSSF